ncbi:GNAT family acetyltransferase [Burkholderia thailandensis]|uniref:GNAT family acetyltransferase n=1 Tax=Burkholderia thailandensis TaxID=57975 RepID=UPI00016A4B28
MQRLTGAAQVGGCAPAPAIHAPHLDAMSLYVSTSTSGEVVSYAAVARKTISHAGKRFSIGGLRWVATDPAHRRAGLGARTIPAATRERRTATPGGHTEGTRGTVKSISRAGRTQKGRCLAAALDSRSKKKSAVRKLPARRLSTPGETRTDRLPVRVPGCAYCCAAAARSFDTSFSLIRADLPERSRR